MQKSTINFQGVDYPVRILDIRGIHSYEDECYANVKVADTSLLLAFGNDECEWSKEAYSMDEKIFFYFSPKQLAKCSDKELIEELEVYL